MDKDITLKIDTKLDTSGAVSGLGSFATAVQGIMSSLDNSINDFAGRVKVIKKSFGLAEILDRIAKSSSKAAAGQDTLARATAATAKAARLSLVSFDELNLLQSSAGAGGGSNAKPSKPDKDKETQEDDINAWTELLERLKRALEPLEKVLWAGLEWGYNNILKPLGDWTVNGAVPALMELLSSSLSVLGGVLEPLKPLAIWLWEGFLVPLANWMGDGVIVVIDGITGGLTALSEWLAGNSGMFDAFIGGIMPMFEGIGGAVMSVFWAIGESLDIWWTSLHDTTAGALELITGLITGNWEQAWQGVKLIFESVSTAIVEMLGTMATGMLDGLTAMMTAWQELLSPLWEWIDLNIITPIAEGFENMFSFINIIAGIAINGLMKLFGPLIDYVSNKVVTPIVENMKYMWKLITEGARSSLDTMIGWIGDHINRTLDIVASGVNFIIGLINQLIEGINKISFELPDWEALGEYAGLSFGFSISTIPPLKIPHLATGAVIPANREFLALLGDQKSGRNLEAPESLIRQIVREESSGQDGQPIAVNLLLDGDVIYRTVLEREERRGVRIGGAFANAY